MLSNKKRDTTRSTKLLNVELQEAYFSPKEVKIRLEELKNKTKN